MKVLIIYAHHNPHSFCHAVLERFCAGLSEAGHSYEVVDLHAIGFDPVFRDRDSPNWIDESVPDDVLANMAVERSLLAAAGHGVRRWIVRRWIGGRGAVQQAKVAAAEALVFISPMYFLSFPAILKGWIDRVFTLGFAFSLSPEAWRGDIGGRLPLLKHRKALVISTTIWDERAYRGALGTAVKTVIDDYSLAYPGIGSVEHVYFHAVHGVDDATRRAYLDRAHGLGREFAG